MEEEQKRIGGPCASCNHEVHPLAGHVESLQRLRMGLRVTSPTKRIAQKGGYSQVLRDITLLLQTIKDTLTKSRGQSAFTVEVLEGIGMDQDADGDDRMMCLDATGRNDKGEGKPTGNNPWTAFVKAEQSVQDRLFHLANRIHSLLNTHDTILRKEGAIEDQSIKDTLATLKTAVEELLDEYPEMTVQESIKDICLSHRGDHGPEMEKTLTDLLIDTRRAESVIFGYGTLIKDSVSESNIALETLRSAYERLCKVPWMEEKTPVL